MDCFEILGVSGIFLLRLFLLHASWVTDSLLASATCHLSRRRCGARLRAPLVWKILLRGRMGWKTSRLLYVRELFIESFPLQ